MTEENGINLLPRKSPSSHLSVSLIFFQIAAPMLQIGGFSSRTGPAGAGYLRSWRRSGDSTGEWTP